MVDDSGDNTRTRTIYTHTHPCDTYARTYTLYMCVCGRKNNGRVDNRPDGRTEEMDGQPEGRVGGLKDGRKFMSHLPRPLHCHGKLGHERGQGEEKGART